MGGRRRRLTTRRRMPDRTMMKEAKFGSETVCKARTVDARTQLTCEIEGTGLESSITCRVLDIPFGNQTELKDVTRVTSTNYTKDYEQLPACGQLVTLYCNGGTEEFMLHSDWGFPARLRKLIKRKDTMVSAAESAQRQANSDEEFVNFFSY